MTREQTQQVLEEWLERHPGEEHSDHVVSWTADGKFQVQPALSPVSHPYIDWHYFKSTKPRKKGT